MSAKKDDMRTFGLPLPAPALKKLKMLAIKLDVPLGKIICKALHEWWEANGLSATEDGPLMPDLAQEMGIGSLIPKNGASTIKEPEQEVLDGN